MDNKYLDKVVKAARNKRIKRRVLALLSAFVLLTTTNQMILLADTLEHTPTCGLEEHEHTSKCYGDDNSIICGMVEHVHTDACYQERPKHDVEEVSVSRVDAEPEQVVMELPTFTIGEEDKAKENGSDTSTEDVIDEILFAEASFDNLVYDFKGESHALLKDILAETGIDFAHVEGYGESDEDPVKCLTIEESQGEITVYITHEYNENDTVELIVFTDDGGSYVIALKNGEKYEEEAEEEQQKESTIEGQQPERLVVSEEGQQPEQPMGSEEGQPVVGVETRQELDETAGSKEEESSAGQKDEAVEESQPSDAQPDGQEENSKVDENEPENATEGKLKATIDEEQEESEGIEGRQDDTTEGQQEEGNGQSEDTENEAVATDGQKEEAVESQPEDSEETAEGQPDDAVEGEPENTSSVRTYEAAIDLSVLKAPYSLKALMDEIEKPGEEAQQESEDAEEAQQEIAEIEATVTEETVVDLVDYSSAENWIIEYDAEILTIEFDGDDYFITPGESFTSAAITVHAGDTFVLNLLGQGKVAEGSATITAADGGVLPEGATARVDEITGEDEIKNLRNLIKGAASIEPVLSTLSVKGRMGIRKSPSKNLNSIPVSDVQEKDDATEETTSKTKYKVLDISLENAGDYDGAFHVDVELDEAITGRDFHLYHIHDGISTELKLNQTEGTIYTLSFDTPNFSQFVFEYTVDFEYQGHTFSILGYDSILLSELFRALEIDVAVESVVDVRFTSDWLVSVEPLEGDWLLTSLEAFASDEQLIVTLEDGTTFVISVTDAQYTDDLSLLFTGLTIMKNGDICDLDAPIIVREGDSFTIDLAFEEHDEFQFMNDGTRMYFEMPDEFHMNESFETMTDVAITVGGKSHVLKNNRVTYDLGTHRVYLQWNTTDPEFAYLIQSGDANVEFSVMGSFDTAEVKEVKFSDSVTVETAPPANAGVEKKGIYDPAAHTITYTLSVRAEGSVMGDIILTDAFIGGGDSALSYVADSVNVSWNEGSTRTEAETAAIKGSFTPASDGKSFTMTIPKKEGTLGKISLRNGEVCVIEYRANVDMTKLNLSTDTAYDEAGNPIQQVFDDTGNTVTLSNPENRYDEPGDNVSTSVQPIQFSDMNKESVLGPATNGVDAQGNEIRYRDITWTVTTNKTGEASLGGSSITDTLTWNPEFIAMQLQPLTGDEAGIRVQRYQRQEGDTDEATFPVGEAVYIPWSALNIKRGTDEEADGTRLSTLTWTWNVPDDPSIGYKYVITYVTRADLADVKVGSTVFNDVYGKGGHDDAQETIWPTGFGDNITVDKEVVSNSLSEIKWGIDVLATTSEYTDYFRVTDTLPSQWVTNPETGEGRRLKDTLPGLEYGVVYDHDAHELNGLLAVTGLQGEETWTAELVNGGPYAADKLLIRFYKDQNGEKVEGLYAYQGSDIRKVDVTYEDGTKGQRDRRLIHIELTTSNDETWVDWATRNMATKSWQAYHENKVQARGDTGHYDFDSARAPIVKPTLVKSLSYGANDATQYNTVYIRNKGKEDGVAYPAYRFLVSVGGIRDDNNTVHTDENGNYILVKDTFDTTKWKLLKSADFSADWYAWMDSRAFTATQPGYPSDANGGVEINQGYTFTETNDGVEIRLYNPPKKEDGSYYNFYTFMYWLVPKDKAAMEAVIADTLREENKQVLAHVTKGVAEYKNTAELVLTEGDSLRDDAAYIYEYNPTSKTVFFDDVNHIATYTVVLNGLKANLVSDSETEQTLEMTDEHSANLSVDYSSIRIYINEETEPDTQNRVTYDYSGNVGTFKIPDETKVTITYEAKLIAAAGTTGNFENTVTMNGFKTTVTETKKISSESTSKAGVYQLNLFKYSNGNMQSGLAGATFRLLDANKRPITDRDGRDITFTTENDGYATITLHEHEQGVSLKKNTTYYLQEIKAPIAEKDGEVTYYRQDPTYYSFLISDNPNYSAPGGVYVYSNGDILKVRNFEDKGGLNISKSFAGNVTLTEGQKAKITFRVEKKTLSGAWSLVREIPYTDFTYSDYEAQNGKRITGTYHYAMEGLNVGDVYRVIERNANIDDEDVTLLTEYLVDGDTSDNGQFTIVPTDVAETNKSSHNVIVTNTYYKPSYTFTKRDAESGAALAGAVFSVYNNGEETPVRTYTTRQDGTFEITEKDEEANYRSGTLYYAVETQAPEGYELPEKPEKYYFYFGGEVELPEGVSAVNLTEHYGTATVANEKQHIDVPVMKTWGKTDNQAWPIAVQYVKIGLYQKETGSTAEPVPVLRDEEPVTLVLTAEDVLDGQQYGRMDAAFTNLPAASDNGKALEYSVKELAVSFDGVNDAEPEDSFTVTYKDVAVGEGNEAVTYKAVNNTDKGTALSVEKVWYAKGAAGETTLIDNPVGEEYARTFHIYRNAMIGGINDSQTKIPVKTNGAYVTITDESDKYLEPGDVVSVYAEYIETDMVGKPFNFGIQYAKKNATGWFKFDPNITHWFDQWNTAAYSLVFTIPTNINITNIYICNFGSSGKYGLGQVTIKKVKSGSTLSGQLSQGTHPTYTSETEEVAEFILPQNGDWEYTSDLLEKYDENGVEYTYWVSEDNATADTTYLYRNGEVTVSNYENVMNFGIKKQWGDDDNHNTGVLVDIYRTVNSIEGSDQSVEGQRTIQLTYPNTSWAHAKSDSGPSEITVKAGDTIRFTFTNIEHRGEDAYSENYNGEKYHFKDWPVSTDTWHKNKWKEYTEGTYYYAIDISVCKNGDANQEIFRKNNGYWTLWSENATWFTDFEVTETVLENANNWQIRLYSPNGNGATVTVEKLNASDSSMTRTALQEYALETGFVKTVELNEENGWALTENNLPMYNSDGQPYHYFALEHSLPGYTDSYLVKDKETIISNAKDEEEEKGTLIVTKSASGLPQNQSDKTFYLTVSRNGYYYKADGSYSIQPVELEVSNNGSVTLNNLPVGIYTITEIMKGEHGAEIPNYRLTSEVIVDDETSTGNTVTVSSDNISATLKNTYEKGVEQIALKVKKNWSPAPTGETSATFTLKRYMSDGVTPDEIAWNEALYTAVLDGETDDRELTPWVYTWPSVDKVYWDYTAGKYVEYVYQVEETSVTYNGVTTDLAADDDAWNVSIEDTDDGWEVTNTRNSVALTLNKLWQGADGTARDWPKNGDAYVPITVTAGKALNVPGLGLRSSKEQVSFTLVPDNAQLRALNASNGCALTVERTSDAYTFTIDGLKETGEMTISGRRVSGTWVYSFTEAQLDGFDAPAYAKTSTETEPTLSSAASGQTIINKQQPVTATLKVTKSVTRADGVTPYEGAWPESGFTFTLAPSSGQADAATATKETPTAQFKPIDFTAAGEYTYTITEQAGEAENYTYDTATHTAVVKVVETNGKLAVESITYDDEADRLTVINKYAEPGEVLFRVKKTYAGGQFTDDEPFTFALTQVTGENAETPVTDGISETVTTAGKTGNVAELSFAPVKLSAGQYWFMIAEKAGTDQNVLYDAHKYWINVAVGSDRTITKNGKTYDPTAIDASFINQRLTSQTATKKWVKADGVTTFAPDSGTTITLQLTQWKKDGTQVMDFAVQPVTLDGTADGAAKTLKASGEDGASDTVYTGQEGSNWTYTWNNLPKVYEEPEHSGVYLEYEYQVIEKQVGDSAVVNGITADGKYLVNVDGMNVVNRKNEKAAEFGKQWRDEGGLPMDWLTTGDENEQNVSIAVHLQRDGDSQYDKALTLAPGTASVTIDEIDHAVTWKLPQDGDARKIYWFSIDGLAKYKADGTEWEYYVTEETLSIDGKEWLTTYSKQNDRAGEQEYIINRNPAAKLTVAKEWYDADGNLVKQWPEGKTLTLYLYRTGSEEALLKLDRIRPGWSGGNLSVDDIAINAQFTDAQPFTLELTGLPAGNSETVYEYFVTEERLPGYAPPTYGNSGEHILRTNGAYHNGVIRNAALTTAITFTKVWRDQNGNNVAWPKDESERDIPISVKLQAEGGAVYEATLDSEGFVTSEDPITWTVSREGLFTIFTASGLPMWGEGDGELQYTVQETGCSGYAASYAFAEETDAGNKELHSKIDENAASNGQYIINTPQNGYTLPSTGGPGTTLYTLAGIFMIFAAIGLLLRKRQY